MSLTLAKHDDQQLVDLVRSAAVHVQAIAVLPGDEKADEIVDKLMAKRPVSKSPLKRKRSVGALAGSP